jgi:DNA-binding MarR family transcriptional regulator
MNKKEKLIEDFRDFFNKLELLNRVKMQDGLKGYKSSQVHCIEFIGKNADANVTKLSAAFYMTRGAISKVTKKLIKKGFIKTYQSPENKKEIYFKLTPKGEKIYQTHDKLHKDFQKRDKSVFDKISDKEFDKIIGFVQKYSKHLDEEMKKQGLDIKE